MKLLRKLGINKDKEAEPRLTGEQLVEQMNHLYLKSWEKVKADISSRDPAEERIDRNRLVELQEEYRKLTGKYYHPNLKELGISFGR